jgi:hypothetical protein
VKLVRVIENRVLRRIFELKGKEITGELRKLHNVEFHSLYFLPDFIREVN